MSRWPERVLIAGCGLAAGSSTAVLVSLAGGTPEPRAMQFLWPALVIVWSSVLVSGHYARRFLMEVVVEQRKMIEAQRAAIAWQERRMAGMRRYN